MEIIESTRRSVKEKSHSFVNYEERKKMSEEVLDLDVPNISQGWDIPTRIIKEKIQYLLIDSSVFSLVFIRLKCDMCF